MKRLIILLLLAAWPAALRAQGWDVSLSVDPFPSPFLSDWQNDPTLASLTLTNGTSQPAVVTVELELGDAAGQPAYRGRSRRLLVNAGEPVVLSALDYADWQTVALDENVREQATQTGMLPEGNYRACVAVRDQWNTVLAQGVCAFFTVLHPEAPEPVYPVRNQTVPDGQPVFQWVTPSLPGAMGVIYTLRIAEIFTGQTAEQALAANIPHYENYYVLSTDFAYPVDALPLEPGKSYAWQVIALDYEGKPVTKNQGKSAVCTFTVGESFAGLLPALELVSPGAHAAVDAAGLAFTWSPLAGAGLIYYTLTVTEIFPGQTPEEAVARNSPLYVNNVALTAPRLAYPADAPALEESTAYAWQVTARDEFGDPAAANQGHSAVRAFTVSGSAGSALLTGTDPSALPERLPLPDERIAYLVLKENGAALVDFAFSPDSSLITVKTSGSLTIPVAFPAFGTDAPRAAASVTLTFNRYSLAIVSGYAAAVPAAADAGGFNLSGRGAPVAVRFAGYQSAAHAWQIEGAAVLFGRVLESSSLRLVLDGNGRLTGTPDARPLTESIPLVTGCDRLQLAVTSLEGTVDAQPAGGTDASRFILGGALRFEPSIADADTRTLPVVLETGPEGLAVRQQTGGPSSLVLPVGTVSFMLSNPQLDGLSYSSQNGVWDFDLVSDLTLQLNDCRPVITLPAIPAVHLTPAGFHLPRVSLPDLGQTQFSAYQDVQIKPYACRKEAAVFNWFAWTGGTTPDLGLRFDLALVLPNLPDRLTDLRAEVSYNPLSVLDAGYRNGRFVGAVEPRQFAQPLDAPLVAGSSWGLSVTELAGSLSDSTTRPPVVLAARAGLVLPYAGIADRRVRSLGDSVLTLTPDGIFSGASGPLNPAVTVPWGGLTISGTEAHVTLYQKTGAQAADMSFTGTVSIPVMPDARVDASGSGVYDLIGNRLSGGIFTVAGPFRLGLPAGAATPFMVLGCPDGATVTRQGLHIPDGPGSIVPENGTPLDVRFSENVTLSLPEPALSAGTITFGGSCVLRVDNIAAPVDGFIWRILPTGSTPVTTCDNMTVSLPQNTKITEGRLLAAGALATAIRLRGHDYTGLTATLTATAGVRCSPTGVTGGRLDIASADSAVAYLDSTGFRPGTFFADDSLPVRLPLPDTAIAYIVLKDAQGKSLVMTEPSGDNLRIFTAPGKPAVLYLPALGRGSAPVPSVSLPLDITVNPRTMTLTGDSLSITASGSDALVSLAGQGVPLTVSALRYRQSAGAYGWTADLAPVLPPVLSGSGLTARDVPLTHNGLSAIQQGYSVTHTDALSAGTVSVGPRMQVTLDGLAVTAGAESVLVSGDILSTFLTAADAVSPAPVHFYGALTTAGLSGVSFNLQHLAGGAVPLGGARLTPAETAGAPDLALHAPMDGNALSLVFRQAVVSLPAVSSGFGVTVTDLTVGPDSLTANGGAGSQTLELYGMACTVEGIEFRPRGTALDLVLAGTGRLFGATVPVSGLTVGTDGTIADTLLNVKSVTCAGSLVTVDTLAVRQSRLEVHGRVAAPAPFDRAAENRFTVGIRGDGTWTDATGKELASKNITVIGAENQSTAEASLGKAPMPVACRLAGLGLAWYGGNADASGQVTALVNTYWPSVGADTVRIPVSGASVFDGTNISRNPWMVLGTVDATCTFAGLVDLGITSMSVPDTGVFSLKISGQVTLNLGGQAADGSCEFTGFTLTPASFTFGRIHEGEFNLGGVTVTVNDLNFGKDLRNLQTYDVSFGADGMEADSVTTAVNGFYLVFSGGISSDLLGFDGGIDQLLLYKSPDKFHILIDNAHFSCKEMFDGRLDLIADIPLTTEDFQFKFLVGGRILVSGKGVAAVGEISYTEKSLTVAGEVQTFKAPGFGLFLAGMGIDVKLLPLPITINDFGAGIFFNPSPEVEDLVRGAVGLGTDADDSDFMQLVNDYKDQFADIMTFLEVYLYGKVSVPDDKIVEGKVLLTLATDKIRLDVACALGDTNMRKLVAVDATGFLELGFPQDFSSYPYAAGNLTISAAAQDQSGIDFFELPSPAEGAVTLEFFVLGAETWAVHGLVDVSMLKILDARFDLFLGPPGFLVDGEVSRTFDAVVVQVEVGMGLMVWCKWTEPKEWGGYGKAWVQATALSEDFAGVRGELGAALIGEQVSPVLPDLPGITVPSYVWSYYLYGYAELTAWFLCWSWTEHVWVEWKDGEIDGGTGGDSRLIAIIDQARAVGEEIMSEARAVEDVITAIRQADFALLSPEQIRAVCDNLVSGQNVFYLTKIREDASEVLQVLTAYQQSSTDPTWRAAAGRYITALTAYRTTLEETFSDASMTDLRTTLEQWSAFTDTLNAFLATRLAEYGQAYDDLKSTIGNLGVRLDSVRAFSNTDALRMNNPVTVSRSTDAASGRELLQFAVDDRQAAANQDNAAALQEQFATWLAETDDRIRTIDSLRRGLYSAIGPGGAISTSQARLTEPLFDQSVMGADLLQASSEAYQKYYDTGEALQDGWVIQLGNGNLDYLRNGFIVSRWMSEEMLNRGYDRRHAALEALAGSPIELDTLAVSRAVASDILAERFYRDVPMLFCAFTRTQLDSLYNLMSAAHTGAADARNDIHRDFTASTDALWNRYAEISENLYSGYEYYLDNLIRFEEAGGTPPVASSVVKEKHTALAGEFTLPGVQNMSLRLNEPAGRYLPTSVIFDWSGSADLGEYAFAVDGGTFQSAGGAAQCTLRCYPPAVASYARSFSVGSRVRNRAGYPVVGRGGTVTLCNRGVGQGRSRLTQDVPVISYVTGTVTVETATEKLLTDRDPAVTTGIIYTDKALRISWEVTDVSGGDARTLFADYQYAVFREKGTQPVLDWTSAGTRTDATVRDPGLRANTARPYEVRVRCVTADGRSIEIMPSAPFYIDRTAPVFPDAPGTAVTLDRSGNRAVVRIDQAHDVFDNGSRTTCFTPVNELAGYEYKTYYHGQDPDSVAWRTIAAPPYDYRPARWYRTAGFIDIDLGAFPMRDSCHLQVRAKSVVTGNDLGYGDPVTVTVPKQPDQSPPDFPDWTVAGTAGRDGLAIAMTRPAQDVESGLRGYACRVLLQAAPDSVVKELPATGLDWRADTVAADRELACRLDRDTASLHGAWLDVRLRSINTAGQWVENNRLFCLAPRRPTLTVRTRTYEHIRPAPPFYVGFTLDGASAVDNYTVVITAGTRPGGADLLRAAYLFGPAYGYRLSNGFSLPDSIGYGRTVYLTAWSETRRIDNYAGKSSEVTAVLQLPDGPMFTAVGQNADGVLTVPVTAPGFSGRKQASYYYEIAGETEVIRPFPAAGERPDFGPEAVTSGRTLVLPHAAADLPPLVTVRLKAVANDGEAAVDEVTYRPVPPAPRVTPVCTHYSDFRFLLTATPDDSCRLMRTPGSSGSTPSYRLNVGTARGKSDIVDGHVLYDRSRPYLVLPAAVGAYDSVHLSVVAVTAYGVASAGTTHAAAAVPLPYLSGGVTHTDQGRLLVQAHSTGFHQGATVAGYQFTVRTAGENQTAIREYPAAGTYDFTPEQWILGQWLELPFDISALPVRKMVIVRLRAVGTDGQENTQDQGYMPYGALPLAAALQPVSDGRTVLRVAGTYEDIYLFGGDLPVFLALGTTEGGTDLATGAFRIGTDGGYQAEYTLPAGLTVGTPYYFSAWYMVGNTKSAVYATQISLPCRPMFTRAEQSGENSIKLFIETAGFNGSGDVSGYQYALGSAPGTYDIRPFPGDRTAYDFAPDAVNAGNELSISRSTLGLPHQTYVALKAVNGAGVEDVCEGSFRASPMTPAVTLLNLRVTDMSENCNYIRWKLDLGSADEKTGILVMKAWYGGVTPEQGRSIVGKGYIYPTWDWTYWYAGNDGTNPVFECPVEKLLLTSWDYYAEFTALDRWREKGSGTYKVHFKINRDLTISTVEVMGSAE